MKISVVVALYNTGSALTRLVASLDAQTMSQQDFETVLVDDGSTDDTPQIARELARTRPNLAVESIPNSGWPGRPRNVGLDRARGEYVFFADHDDVFAPRALEALYEMADRNHSDIVYGKIVRLGRDTPYWPVWAADLDVADPTGPVILSRTVHKLYRRQFLQMNDLRFREGRVRLEDHEFMARALPKAQVISVLAREPVYYWIHRNDRSNASDSSISPAEYWAFYDDVLDSWERSTDPGPLLDAARVVSAIQAFTRFPARQYLAGDEQRRADLVAALHPLFARRIPPELDHRLPVLKRLRVAALRDGDRGRFDTFQEVRQRYSFAVRVDEVELRAGRLHVKVTGRCVTGEAGEVVRPEIADGRRLLPLPDAPAVDDDARALLDEDLGTAEITIRHRPSGVEWPVTSETTRDPDALAVTVAAAIDLDRNAFGSPLVEGSWDVYVRLQFLGEALLRRVEAAPTGDAPTGDAPTSDTPTGDEPAEAVPDGGEPAGEPAAGAEPATLPAPAYATAKGFLSFAVGRPAEQRPAVTAASWAGRELRLDVEDVVHTVVYGARSADAPRHRVAAAGGTVLVPIDDVADDGSGVLDLWSEDDWGGLTRLAYTGPDVACVASGATLLSAYATAHGSISVRRREPPPPPPPAPPAAARRVQRKLRIPWGRP